MAGGWVSSPNRPTVGGGAGRSLIEEVACMMQWWKSVAEDGRGSGQRGRAGIEWRWSLVDGGDGEIGGNVVRLVELRVAVKWFLGSRINW